jgi:hypothetical protein
VPTATQERVNLASVPVNLAVIAEVGRLERPLFTWNPVEQMWVHERGGEAKSPPAPHDVHAIQTWFLDTDENEWIQTVLGPIGRQLAEQWRGAYRIPDSAIVRKTAPTRGRSPLSFAIAGVVLLALIGGVAVAAPALMNPAAPAPADPTAPIAAVSPPASVAPTPEPTPEPTEAPATPPPATARPRPAGITYTLRNGTLVIYTGATTATRGGTLVTSFTVQLANGRAASGSFGVFLNDPQTVSNRRAATGNLDGAGRIVLQLPMNVTSGTYQLQFSYGGETAQIATVTVR